MRSARVPRERVPSERAVRRHALRGWRSGVVASFRGVGRDR